ncbi:hypothetical protein SK128_021923 [Halocaridina rubra]|uniref:Uncharacterized protein n=1 Tax=Halocaridina rubra TaxID=373956 RepID=A0AAN8WMX1_HALRR
MGEITLKTSLCLLTLLVTLAVLETPYCHAAAIVAPSPSLSPEVASLMQEYWDWTLSSSPEYSTFFGIHDNDHLLDDMSLAGYQSRYDQFKEFHKQAVALQANYTSPYDSVNLRALVAEFENYLDSFYYERYLTPLSYLGGIHSDFSDGLSYMLTDKLDDYKKILSRIHAFPTQIEQVGELLRIGVSKGIVMHNISMKGVVDEIGGHVVDKAEDSPFWEHFSNITTPDATAEGIEEIQKTARSIILDEEKT